jgi:hypothetical protein
MKMLEAKTDSVLTSDGAGGWVDRSPAKGTIQHQVNELCHGKKVTWQVTLALDAVMDELLGIWAITPKQSKKQKHARVLWISTRSTGISKRSEELNLKKGSKICLEGVIGDARKRPRFFFNGVNAVYHLRSDDDDEDSTAFIIGFDKVTIRPIRNSGE